SAFAVLYAASIALPAMLQALFGYDAYRAGLVLSPAGVSSITAMVMVGFLLGGEFPTDTVFTAFLDCACRDSSCWPAWSARPCSIAAVSRPAPWSGFATASRSDLIIAGRRRR